MKELLFYSLSSGSSGNCYYLGNESKGILIDAGISATAIRRSLKEAGISFEAIMGVLITHKHTDHVRGLEVLARRNNIPVFTTKKIWESIISPKSKLQKYSFREIILEQMFSLAGFNIEAFPVSHDAPETIGFHLCIGEKKITIVTDLGHICQTSSKYIKAANFLVIESNYDENMLENGRYPIFLKRRIRSDKGHLGNHQTSAFLADIFNDDLSHICLAHLSKNNNTPELAMARLEKTFAERGITLNGGQKISILNRNIPSEMIKLSLAV